MTISVYVPRETVAVSLGADDIAERLDTLDNVNVIRNGSWGASWLEPMLEVVVEDQRIAYGPVLPDKVDDLLEAGFLEGGEHPLRLGPTEEIPYLANQERWTFALCGRIDPLCVDDFVARGGFTGLEKAFEIGPDNSPYAVPSAPS